MPVADRVGVSSEVSRVIAALLTQTRGPLDAYRCVEKIQRDAGASGAETVGPPLQTNPNQVQRQKEMVLQQAGLFATPEDAEPAAVKFPHLAEELAMLEWAGVGVGRAEAYRLYLSIKRLAETLPAEVEALRFWGRVGTLAAPYFVLEGGNTEEEEAEDSRAQEGRDGLNRNAYWVSQTLAPGSWQQLPQVTCAQVVASCRFRRFLTGSLEAPVPSYPPFPGRERSLLRALIARITGATLISPEGYFKIEDEEAAVPVVVPVEPDELKERPPASGHALCEATAWRHHERAANALGRVTALPEELDDNGDPVPSAAALLPVTPALSPLQPAHWALRVCPAGAGATNTSLAMARSLQWPGAVVVASPQKFVCVYFGDGLEHKDTRFSPASPLGVAQEPSILAFLEEADTVADPTPPPPPEPEEQEEQEGGEENEED